VFGPLLPADLAVLLFIILVVLIRILLPLHQTFTRDYAEELLGDLGVVADDDQHGRCAVLSGSGAQNLLMPFPPFARQGQQGVLRLAINDFGFGFAAREALASLQVLCDVVPQVEELGIRPAGVIHCR